MSPPDGKKFVYVNRTPSRRSISARDFTLPKPYRKPTPGDTLRGASRLRITLLAFSGLLIAGLIAALAMLAHDNANSPHALAIVRAEQARSAPPAPTPETRPRAAKPAAKPGNTAIPVLAASPMLPVQASLPALADELPVLFMRPPAMPDPDVDLIAAILLLSPDRAPPHLPDCRGALFELNACATMLP